jgi:alpha-galactosidase
MRLFAHSPVFVPPLCESPRYDIQKNWPSVFGNLQTLVPFQDRVEPLSRPGCWAYPDMLEVGNLASFEEDRAHFGAW